jgi:transcriptional regulator NrdR family protein
MNPKYTDNCCSSCGGQSLEVIESRQRKDWRRRRHSCVQCGHRWTTYEISAERFEEYRAASHALRAILDCNSEYQQKEAPCSP